MVENFIRDYGVMGMLILVLVSVVVIFLLLLIGDLIFFAPVTIDGTVMAQVYSPAQNGSSVGPVIGSNGDVGVVVVNSYSAEKWTLVIRTDGKVKSYEVSPEVYYSVKPGDAISMICAKGKFIGIVSCGNATIK